MNSIAYTEDKQKLKSLGIKTMVFGLIGVVVGIVILKGNSGNFSMLGYMKAGLGGGLLGGGACALFMGVRLLLKMGKPPAAIVSADDKGVTIKTGEKTNRLITWQDITSFSPAQKGIQSGVAVILKEPAKYMNALSAKEKAAAKQNERFLGSPASVRTNICAASKEAIAGELNKALESFQK